jgi:hypothetical protein
MRLLKYIVELNYLVPFQIVVKTMLGRYREKYYYFLFLVASQSL